jgi:hypothetical protein
MQYMRQTISKSKRANTASTLRRNTKCHRHQQITVCVRLLKQNGKILLLHVKKHPKVMLLYHALYGLGDNAKSHILLIRACQKILTKN